jgi:hypothetical protein
LTKKNNKNIIIFGLLSLSSKFIMKIILDLFNNPVGCRRLKSEQVLRFFRLYDLEAIVKTQIELSVLKIVRGSEKPCTGGRCFLPDETGFVSVRLENLDTYRAGR